MRQVSLFSIDCVGQSVQEYSAIVSCYILQTNQSNSFTRTAFRFRELVFCFDDAY